MKIIADTRELLEAVRAAWMHRGSRRSTAPILDSIRITTDDGRVCIESTGEYAVRVVLGGVDLQEPGAVLVPKAGLERFLATCPDAQVTLASENGCRLRITSAHSRINLHGFPPDEVSKHPTADDSVIHITTLSAAVLPAMLGRVAPATRHAASRSEQLGESVIIDARQDGCRISAISNVMAVSVGDWGIKDAQRLCVSLPALLGVANAAAPGEGLSIHLDADRVWLRLEDRLEMIAPRTLKPVPPFEDLVEYEEAPEVCRIDSGELAKVCEAMRTVWSKDEGDIRGAVMTFTGNELSASCVSSDVGEIRRTVELEAPVGTPMAAKMNPDLLGRLLKPISGEVAIHLRPIKSETRAGAAMYVAATEGGYRSVIMAMSMEKAESDEVLAKIEAAGKGAA